MRALETADRFAFAWRQIFVHPCFRHFSSSMLINPLFRQYVPIFPFTQITLQFSCNLLRAVHEDSKVIESRSKIVTTLHLRGRDLHGSMALQHKLLMAR